VKVNTILTFTSLNMTSIDSSLTALTINISENECMFNGEDLLVAIDGGKLNCVTTLTIEQSKSGDLSKEISDYFFYGFQAFDGFLSSMLEACTNLEKLALKDIRINACLDFFSALPVHPPHSGTGIKTLELSYCAISDNDMHYMGPCFPSVEHLIWNMNTFNEVYYESHIEPYFDKITYENDYGWYPECEIMGDGQRRQAKNSQFYMGQDRYCFRYYP